MVTTNGDSRVMPSSPVIQPTTKAPISSTTLPFNSTSRSNCLLIPKPCPTGARDRPAAFASNSPVRIAGVSITATTATM